MSDEMQKHQQDANNYGKQFIKSTTMEIDELDELEDITKNPVMTEEQLERRDELDDSLRANYGVEMQRTIIITLGGGGPAMRIVYFPDEDRAEYQFQNWFLPWVPAQLTNEEEEALLDYCQRYYEIESII